ncbi:hypothetical protein [Fructilactobacillus sanfranciscensis]|nr:hypothetical protein [Fructilactobacillus sanfranciscensis]
MKKHVPGKTNWQYQPYQAAYLPSELVEKLNPLLNEGPQFQLDFV